MRISLEALQTLDAIVRNGSFAAAASELHKVPSAVTYVIQKLEQDLDVQLFDRSGHRAKLTDVGRSLLEEGRHLLRAAREVEARVRKARDGWEPEIAIHVDEVIPLERVFPMLERFYAEGGVTRVRLGEEILAGTWDALLTGRADLIIGATGDPPSEGGCSLLRLGSMEFVFAVSPDHPLASAPLPLAPADIRGHRSIAAADSARFLGPRTTGVMPGQDTLTVPSMAAKLRAQERGLGVGYLPRLLAAPSVNAGRLVVREVAETKPVATVHAAWRGRPTGKALSWFVRTLAEDSVQAELLG